MKGNQLSDLVKMGLLGLLIGASFLTGVIASNQQVRGIIVEIRDITDEVKADLEAEIKRQDQALEEHRERDREHICFSSLDHLDHNLALRDLARQARLDVRNVRTHLRKEVINVCAEIESPSSFHPSD